TMMSCSVSLPLSRPETVIAACRASSRREKLLLVAGVQPACASSRTLVMISPARCRSTRGAYRVARRGLSSWGRAAFMPPSLAPAAEDPVKNPGQHRDPDRAEHRRHRGGGEQQYAGDQRADAEQAVATRGPALARADHQAQASRRVGQHN